MVPGEGHHGWRDQQNGMASLLTALGPGLRIWGPYCEDGVQSPALREGTAREKSLCLGPQSPVPWSLSPSASSLARAKSLSRVLGLVSSEAQGTSSRKLTLPGCPWQEGGACQAGPGGAPWARQAWARGEGTFLLSEHVGRGFPEASTRPGQWPAGEPQHFLLGERSPGETGQRKRVNTNPACPPSPPRDPGQTRPSPGRPEPRGRRLFGCSGPPCPPAAQLSWAPSAPLLWVVAVHVRARRLGNPWAFPGSR